MSNPLEAYGEPDPAPAESGGGPPASADTSIGWINFSDLTDLLEMGGPVTLVLLAMSLITLTVILAKLWQFARAGVGRFGALDEALAFWSRGRQDEAAHRLIRQRGVASRVALHAMSALRAGADEHHVREDTERVALSELTNLQSGLRVIEATVQTAPLLGLFGTVLGMIASFQALEGSGAQADPAVLAGGIWVALTDHGCRARDRDSRRTRSDLVSGADRSRARAHRGCGDERVHAPAGRARLRLPRPTARSCTTWQAEGPDGGARREAL